MIKVGVNGFGRIGRVITRINAENNNFSLCHINDIAPNVDNMLYLFKYDSTYGKYDKEVSSNNNIIKINNDSINYTSERDICDIDWKGSDVDCIIESSGVASNVEGAKKLVADGVVKFVVVTHSSNLADNEIIMGVNDDSLTTKHKVVSSSICDANSIAHILSWIDEEYGIKTGSVTTVHPWLSYQNLVDGPSQSQVTPGNVWSDYSLGRSSINNLIPKNTTAVSATEKVVTSIKGKLASFSYRVPTDIVSSSDITIIPEKLPSYNQLVSFLEKKVSESKYVSLNRESLVSIDYRKNSNSGIIDMQWLKVHNGVIKAVMWYDNEWGYGSRVIDLISKLMSLK